jgi:glycosyltransferase involved in cell wall biosynthesis
MAGVIALRIAVDADNLYRFAHRGIQKTLVTLYCRLAATYPSWEFILYRQVGEPLDVFAAFSNITQRQIDIKGDSLPGRLWEQVRLPLAAWLAGADVLHSPSNTGPAFSRVPLVLTIHDLTPLQFFPDSPDTRRWYGRLRRAAQRAAMVITPSQAVADDVAAQCRIESSRITVAYWAVNEGYSSATIESTALILAAYDAVVTKPFVLMFGSKNPRKNLSRVLEAWAALAPPLRDQWRLLAIGVEEDAIATYKGESSRLGIAESVQIHGAVPEAHVPALLRAAEVLCYPSLSEGFGVPIVEAFACGTCVLTSNLTSLPEVAGDAAVLVDPKSTTDLTAGLGMLMTDEALRQRLVAAGRRRLELFSWERCVSVHAKVFERAARA